jgi:hypothetical protein
MSDFEDYDPPGTIARLEKECAREVMSDTPNTFFCRSEGEPLCHGVELLKEQTDGRCKSCPSPNQRGEG